MYCLFFFIIGPSTIKIGRKQVHVHVTFYTFTAYFTRQHGYKLTKSYNNTNSNRKGIPT